VRKRAVLSTRSLNKQPEGKSEAFLKPRFSGVFLLSFQGRCGNNFIEIQNKI
jgi:hypothetical protein